MINRFEEKYNNQQLDILGLKPTDVAELVAFIKAHPDIKYLSIGSNTITDAQALPLMQSIAVLNKLEYLNIAIEIAAVSANALVGVLPKLVELKAISVSSIPLPSQSIIELAKMLPGMPLLENIKLFSWNLGDEALTALTQSIVSLTALNTLNLWAPEATDESVVLFARALDMLPALSSITFRGKMTDAGILAMHAALAYRNTEFTVDSYSKFDAATSRVLVEKNPVNKANNRVAGGFSMQVPGLLTQSIFAVKQNQDLVSKAKSVLPIELQEKLGK